jgi:hypothetical protein
VCRELVDISIGGVGKLEVCGIEEREFRVIAVASSGVIGCDSSSGKKAEGDE